MYPEDEEKTPFITDRGSYCYKVMHFGLKNAGATYQRLVTKMFQQHLRKTMEVYINEMLVKSTSSRAFERSICNSSKIQHEVEPREMCIWCRIR